MQAEHGDRLDHPIGLLAGLVDVADLEHAPLHDGMLDRGRRPSLAGPVVEQSDPGGQFQRPFGVDFAQHGEDLLQRARPACVNGIDESTARAVATAATSAAVRFNGGSVCCVSIA